ncbi:hypothetical protein ADUPG1_000074 [Aduncisulcus paluster]|uniref:Vacuolar ATPase assembly integral membrane protein VMA21 homolog n=1 Tax=Aduncisulcus paluster TaxID=2918883 RepID=A0ABQ5K6N9_9EUKA|nr:hypothetical protein ADUPG1_000074 [Aduncisulcus paluster]
MVEEKDIQKVKLMPLLVNDPQAFFLLRKWMFFIALLSLGPFFSLKVALPALHFSVEQTALWSCIGAVIGLILAFTIYYIYVVKVDFSGDSEVEVFEEDESEASEELHEKSDEEKEIIGPKMDETEKEDDSKRPITKEE